MLTRFSRFVFCLTKDKMLAVILLFVCFFIPFCISAQDLEVDYPNIGGTAPKTVQYGLPGYVKYVFTFAIGTIGIVALSVIIWGGFLYLTSSGNAEKMKEGREKITAAFLGIVILASSYIILATINPQLVLFDIPDLPDLPVHEVKIPPEIKPEDATYISSELPLAQSINEGLWDKEKMAALEKTIIDFENFINSRVNVNDSDLENPLIRGVADLHKYLSTLTHQCRAENLTAYCASPESGCMPIGCQGDPCQTDQDLEVEPDSPRGKINITLAINEDKKANLNKFKEAIENKIKILREDLRKFQEIEGEIVNCHNQNKELILIADYLKEKQGLQEQGIEIKQISSPYASRGNSLTFYCSAGGTVYDSSFSIDLDEGNISSLFGEVSSNIGCPVRYNTGEVFDKLREYAVEEIFRLNHVSALIESLVHKMQEMQNLVSQCNDKNSRVKCGCQENFCLGCCSPIPCGGCVPFCMSKCIQCSQSCSGEACPTAQINEKAEEINEIEFKILKEIVKIKKIFADVPSRLIELNNLSQQISSCKANDDWDVFSCRSIMDMVFVKTYDGTGRLITKCHPKDLYCCTNPDYSGTSNDSAIYILPADEFKPLPTENNCPAGWDCTEEVRDYNQYKDASEPLQQLLSCMRLQLNQVQIKENLDYKLGIIAAISDINIYKNKCDWDAGPIDSGDCSYSFEVEKGKTRISAHYGGAGCSFNRQSYAVKLNMAGDQSQYIDEIITAAKKCNPAAYILDKTPYLHIDVGDISQCKTAE
ncbi:MAG: hypothetical protein A2427_04795 [Candidatus Nealsonbacteria bacterium RIFOXYC1_FULL_40_7]|uniref:4Fe-4S ferredoxin-type domain-containing protein n=2 Tax=Candidatus Nealsoniibacteriota TaxID=1817911 RepID=A0A1G2ER88_9BACT|nr:MAG: hypothetical protein A2427_04795 [Candidatus Nealsonbacteria bacterium RIFOXYC1_FULL_40_7]